MGIPAARSAHVDTFAGDNLPADALQPTFLWTHPNLQYPDRLNCAVELLDGAVARGDGQRACLRDATGRQWTYGEVLEWANRIANVLITDHGLVPGNRVLLRGPNSPWLAACWLAVQKAGLVAVATMPMLRAGELSPIIDQSQAHFALCDQRFLDELTAATSGTAATDGTTAEGAMTIVAYGDGSELAAAMVAQPSTFDNCETAASDVALIAFTSGTTGRPKGCAHLHRDVLAIADTFSREIVQPSPDDLFAGSPPLAFTYGLGGLLVFPMRVGACTLLLEAATPAGLLQAIADHRVTICWTAPTAFRAMLDAIPTTDLSSLRKAVAAGEPLPSGTRIAFRQATGINIIDALGATEMLHVFISASGGDIRDGAVGKPVAGYEAMIVDDEFNEMPDGEIGRLAVRGPTGCRYLADDRQTAYVHDGWNLPGDSMRRDEDGYFWYVSRADDMIISSGYNIAGPEVEGAILSHAAVAECACVGIPDESRGMIVKAFVVLKDPGAATPEMATMLKDHVKQTIAPYKYPREIEFRAELPKTATGKLQRFKLRNESR